MKTKHTPGPWRRRTMGYYLPVKTCLHPLPIESTTTAPEGFGVVVAYVTDDNGTEQQAADGNLIAAAPDMLHALTEIIEGLEHAGCSSPHCSGTCHYCATRRRARAAIQKATGET